MFSETDMAMSSFWDTDTLHAYEAACGDEPGIRSRLLAASDWQTRVVDLSLSEVEMWLGMRKSYRSLIRAAEKRYLIADGGALACRQIHVEVAKCETRPSETWATMQVWIDQGNGLAMVAVDGGKAKGFVYCTIYGAWSYYFSSACLERNMTHALLWAAMRALKRQGVRWFELGWMDRNGDTLKDYGIAHFKRGFGGFDMPAKEAPALWGAQEEPCGE